MATAIDVKDAAGATVSVATNDAVKTSVDAVKTSTDALASLITTLDGSVDAVTAAVLANTAAVTAGSVTSLGAKTIANSPAVNIASDQIVAVDQKSLAHDVAVTVTRPANVTAYTAGDVVGGVIQFAAAGKNAGSILINGVELEYDVTALPSGMSTFRLYLYSATPPSALADNAVWTATADKAVYLGYIDLGSPILLGAAFLYASVDGISKQRKLATADLFAYLVTTGAYTPAANSEVLKVTLHSADL
ncbi:hypothetical protein [Rhizobium laguerreae]|uniref:hypothetical protein n=1 Tax=Rhizobium laguerreae TaxID=1076926 RepID=UPI001C92581D|nr:hypothetical protein [Rhizobium laguerreae]MBY3434804.1 hypothetical protein [Rhizobium laguerreae]MBY3448947.1 hypothetical protein [Rhizobium laguerreae]MBY3456721.1 hypothetical protein [Rhizobium laguerreae]